MTNCQWKRQSTGKNPDVIHMGIITHTKKHPIPHVSSLEVTPHSNDKQKKKKSILFRPLKEKNARQTAVSRIAESSEGQESWFRKAESQEGKLLYFVTMVP